MDFCTCVQQHTIAHDCAILNTGVLHQNTSTADLSKRTYVGTGSNDVGKSKAKYFCFLIHLRPKPIVSDAHHQKVIVLPQLRQISKTTNHRNAANINRHRLPIVYENTVVLEHRLLGHHASKTTSTDQQELFLRHWEYPSTRSAHTQWS